MAINITEVGSLDNQPTFKRTCPICGTKIEFLWSDTHYNNYLGGFRAVTCPTCQYEIAALTAGGEMISIILTLKIINSFQTV